MLSRSRSVTPADRSYDLIDAATYNFINSSRPPKILESPLDSKSLSAGEPRLSESSCVTDDANTGVREHTRHSLTAALNVIAFKWPSLRYVEPVAHLL